MGSSGVIAKFPTSISWAEADPRGSGGGGGLQVQYLLCSIHQTKGGTHILLHESNYHSHKHSDKQMSKHQGSATALEMFKEGSSWKALHVTPQRLRLVQGSSRAAPCFSALKQVTEGKWQLYPTNHAH
jgi:hypothetical protein